MSLPTTQLGKTERRMYHPGLRRIHFDCISGMSWEHRQKQWMNPACAMQCLTFLPAGSGMAVVGSMSEEALSYTGLFPRADGHTTRAPSLAVNPCFLSFSSTPRKTEQACRGWTGWRGSQRSVCLTTCAATLLRFGDDESLCRSAVGAFNSLWSVFSLQVCLCSLRFQQVPDSSSPPQRFNFPASVRREKSSNIPFLGGGKDDEGFGRKKYRTSLCSLLPLHPHQQHMSSSSSHPPPVDHLRKTQILTHALPCTPRPRAGPWRSGRSFPQRMTTRSDV